MSSDMGSDMGSDDEGARSDAGRAAASRRAEVAANVADVRDRMARACRAADRDPSEVTLIGVTKTFSAADVLHLVAAGVHDVGESRDQEASAKHAAVTSMLPADHGPVRWHFIGQLQRNKARSVAQYTDVVHSVDRLALGASLSEAAAARSRPLVVLVQVDLDDTEDRRQRGGITPGLAPGLAVQLAELPGLVVGGVMAVAPLGGDPHAAFARLAATARAVQESIPGATIISAGMSQDLEAAIAHGATHVRVGSALLGKRPALGYRG